MNVCSACKMMRVHVLQKLICNRLYILQHLHLQWQVTPTSLKFLATIVTFCGID